MDQDYFEFKLHLQGKALEGHTIDAKELGVALIGINDSLDIIAKQMPGARQKQTSLQIQAREALQKLPLPSRMEQKCSVRLFLTTPECAVFFANTIVKY